MKRAQNKALIIVLIYILCHSCSLVQVPLGANSKGKKYPVNSYLDSLIKNTRLVEICEIISTPEVKTENGNKVYTFSLQPISITKNYPFAVGGSYRFTVVTTNVQYTVTNNDQSNSRLLQKGKKLIFFAKAIKIGETPTYNGIAITGFVHPTKSNLYYIQHTFREGKTYEVLSVYHKGKKPKKDRNRVTRKEHYWTYYENGYIKSESIRINKLSMVLVNGHKKGKKKLKVFYSTHNDKRNYYYENGMPKEKIKTEYKFEKNTGDKITKLDTIKFDSTGKIIYVNQEIRKSNNKNDF